MDTHTDQEGLLVSVVTPFYNTASYLAECIESVIAQTHQNFEYLLVNNKSTDGSREIASSYAARDARIRLIDNEAFLPQVENYNGALSQIGPDAKYVKIVQADDRIMPDCLRRMVEVAERDPRIGLVSSLYKMGHETSGEDFPFRTWRVPGRELCRHMLLFHRFFFGSPTNVLYRADVVRSRRPFYTLGRLHEDTEAAYEILLENDFGFVHEILSFMRTDNESVTSAARRFNTDPLDYVITLERYGPRVLTESEFEPLKAKEWGLYLAFLGSSVARWRETAFWDYHRRGLATIERTLPRGEIARHAAGQFAYRVRDAVRTVLKGLVLSVLRVLGRANRGIGLRAGDWVEVRSKEEILRTLDSGGRLDGLPFMPQMFQYCGSRFRVFKRAHKTCDTIHGTGGRRMDTAVHLEGIHCGGEAYAGCDAACLIFWKDVWLKRVRNPQTDRPGAEQAGGNDGRSVCTEEDVYAGTRADWTVSDPRYACQATELFRATERLPWWDVRQYLEDYESGNASLAELLGGVAYVISVTVINRLRNRHRTHAALIRLYDRVQKLRGGVPFPRRTGRIPAGQKTPLTRLGVAPGEVIWLKPYEEILGTLDTQNKNRGLYFDAEEVPYCGNAYHVRSRVEKIIDERTGQLISIKSGGAVILDGVWCKGFYSEHRMFCPRAIFPFFRETWLQREPSSDPAGET